MLTMSWSKKTCLQTCHRMFYYKYIENVVPKKFSKSLNFGKVFHSVVAELYKKDLSSALEMIDKEISKVDTTSFQQEDFDELQWQTIVLNSVILNINDTYYAEDVARKLQIVEIEEHTRVRPTCNGKKIPKAIYEYIPDLVVKEDDGSLWLVEYKTTSRLDSTYFDRLQIDEQTNGMIYFLEKKYNQKFAGVIFRVIKKPSIRQTKKETSSQFFDRLQDVMTSNYGDYFYEKTFLRDAMLISEFEVNLSNTFKNMKFIIKNKLYYKDTSKCSLYKCGYLPLCSNQSGSGILYEPKKSREEEEEENVQSI